MNRLTDEQLAEIRTRAEDATAGPWEYDVNSHCINAPGLEVCVDLMWYDAEFIAHAREDVPKLLDTIASMSAEIERLKAELQCAEQKTEDIVEELFGDKIRESAKRIADELRRKLGDPNDSDI